MNPNPMDDELEIWKSVLREELLTLSRVKEFDNAGSSRVHIGRRADAGTGKLLGKSIYASALERSVGMIGSHGLFRCG